MSTRGKFDLSTAIFHAGIKDPGSMPQWPPDVLGYKGSIGRCMIDCLPKGATWASKSISAMLWRFVWISLRLNGV